MRCEHPFRVMCCPVNVYCDRDISCIVIVTSSVTSIVKTSNRSLYCSSLGHGPRLGPWPRLEGLIEDQLPRKNPQIVTFVLQ